MGLFSKKKGTVKVAEEEKKENAVEPKSAEKKQEDWMNLVQLRFQLNQNQLKRNKKIG